MVTRESAVLPVHDPTTRTTDQLRHELESLKNLIEYRLDGMDTATKLVHENFTRFPTEIDKQMLRARELTDEKFASLKEAATARHESNAEAIAKSEAATTKQIDAIHALFASTNKAMDEKLGAITARLDRSEGRSRGLGDGWGYLVGAVGVLVAIASVVLALVNKG